MIRPVGFPSASFSLKNMQPKTTQPHFAGEPVKHGDNEQQSGERRLSAEMPLLSAPQSKQRWFVRPQLSARQRLELSAWMSKLKKIHALKPSNSNLEQAQRAANHELGHAIAGLIGGIPMGGLHIVNNVLPGTGGVTLFDRSRTIVQDSQAGFWKGLIVLMAGYGAELNRATPEQLADERFMNASCERAYSDIVQAVPLIQHAQQQGWLNKRTSSPLFQNTDWKNQLAKLTQKGQFLLKKDNRTSEETEELRNIILQGREIRGQVREFLETPVIKQAVQASREIYAAVPEQKREAMIGFVVEKGVLDHDELYSMLEHHLSNNELKRMQAILERFIKVHDPNIPYAPTIRQTAEP